jgi:predicted protein tyrosine phosphatase
MKLTATVTTVAEINIDEADYKHDDGTPMTEEQICAQVREEVLENWPEVEVDSDGDFEVQSVEVKKKEEVGGPA